MKLIDTYGNGAEIWQVGALYLVYGRTADPYTTDSLTHARDVAGSCRPVQKR